MGSSCSSEWYKVQWFDDSIFAVLQPNGAFKCTPAPTASNASATIEFSSMVAITMIFGLLFILIILVRSLNPIKTDWYRLIAAYVIGTLGVPLSIALGPSEGGFNRVIGFGILIHNLFELEILGHIWFGSRGQSALGFILYVWLIMTLNTFLPMAPLFLILMIQGSFCDWSLVYSLIYMGHWMDKHHHKHCKSMGCYGKLGSLAAIMHILSIQPLFYGMATTYGLLNGITVIFLVPTFILYAWFSSADVFQKPVLIGTAKHSKSVLDYSRNIMLRDMVLELKKQADHVVVKGETPRRRPSSQNDVEMTVVNNDYGLFEENGSTNGVELILPQSMIDIGDDNDDEFTYGSIINSGLSNIDDSAKRTMWRIIAASLLTCVANSILVFLAPCYINISVLVC